MQIVPVILCGGSGTRLWPVSRDSFPKQFVPLLGQYSTFQATLKRVADVSLFAKPVIVTNHKFRFLIEEQAQAVNVPVDIIMEPEPRDSAPAIAVAGAYSEKRDPESLVLILAADHVINDTDGFRNSVREAAASASVGTIMTFGVKPTAPSTALGYIQAGEALKTGGHSIAHFIEKPKHDVAIDLVEQGCLWNSGNFMFMPSVMRREFETFAPEIQNAADAALAMHKVDLGAIALDATEFARATKISIDYAIMQKTSHAGVIEAGFDWSDVGTWGSLWDASSHDTAGNRVSGPVEVHHTQNSLVHSDDILTIVHGVENLVVVATKDAILITDREKSGEVKTLVDDLKKRNVREASEHLKMYRPWGSYQRIDIGTRFQVKRITVKPGGRLSLQKHFHRSEHWVVVSGTAEVTVGDKTIELHENESTYIPIGEIHRLVNPGKVPLELIEVQVGSYTGEDDIVRVEDVYGRQ
jgi:mannose-1-phosphate guanylyltransferase/mannose-6-phosphate isomerase